MAIAYGIILTIATVLLTAQHLADRGASMKSKVLITAVAVTTFLLPASGIGWTVAATLGRLAVCLFVLLRAIAQRPA